MTGSKKAGPVWGDVSEPQSSIQAQAWRADRLLEELYTRMHVSAIQPHEEMTENKSLAGYWKNKTKKHPYNQTKVNQRLTRQ